MPRPSLPKPGALPGLSERLKLAVVAIGWLLLTTYLVRLGNRYVPDSWKVRLSFESFQIVCQAATLAVGLATSVVLLDDARARLGLGRPRGGELCAVALLAPLVFVATSVIALQIALPTLLAELTTRGVSASAENAGRFGRSLGRTPLFVTLLWGGVLAALGEELLFRGALWSAVHELATSLVGRRSPATAGVRAWRGRVRERVPGGVPTGIVATLVSAGALRGAVT